MKVSSQLDREVEPGTDDAAAGQDGIHPTAIIHPDAKLGANVSVGPYTVIGEKVTIGDDTVVYNHVTIHGITRIGSGNRFYPYCAVGLDPQDKAYGFEGKSELEIGNDNTFRESVTLHRGTPNFGGITRIGSGNWLLAYSHVAHDCKVGDETVFANNAIVGGCVTVGDRAYLGGFTAVHPFCSVGEVVITGGHTMVGQDVPPYVNATGNRAKLYGLNKIGMKRAGMAKEEIDAMGKAYRIFFRGKLSAKEALARLDAEFPGSPSVKRFAEFIRNSKRGICR